MHGLRGAWQVVRGAVRNTLADHVPMQAAALAFYTSLSLGPLLLVLLWALSFLGPGSERVLVREAESLVGPDARALVESVLESAEDGVRFQGIAGALSLTMLLLGATAVFGQLQATLNRVWEVQVHPGAGPWRWLRKRILSLGMVGAIAFLLLVSLAASTAVGMVEERLGGAVASRMLSFGSTLVVFTLLFASMYKLLPDVHIAWRDVWWGAAVTALLFALGKVAIGLYIARKGFGTTYGAAGSIVAVLTWVYYSSSLVLLGAELTQEWVRRAGRRLEPDQYAERVDRACQEDLR